MISRFASQVFSVLEHRKDHKEGPHAAFSHLGSSINVIRLEIMDFHNSSFLETS